MLGNACPSHYSPMSFIPHPFSFTFGSLTQLKLVELSLSCFLQFYHFSPWPGNHFCVVVCMCSKDSRFEGFKRLYCLPRVGDIPRRFPLTIFLSFLHFSMPRICFLCCWVNVQQRSTFLGFGRGCFFPSEACRHFLNSNPWTKVL